MDFLDSSSPQRSILCIGQLQYFDSYYDWERFNIFICLVFYNSEVPVTGLLEINVLIQNFDPPLQWHETNKYKTPNGVKTKYLVRSTEYGL